MLMQAKGGNKTKCPPALSTCKDTIGFVNCFVSNRRDRSYPKAQPRGRAQDFYEKGLETRCLVESQVAQAHFLIFLMAYGFDKSFSFSFFFFYQSSVHELPFLCTSLKLCFTSNKHYRGFNVEERCSCEEGFTTDKCVIYVTTVVPVTRVVSMKNIFS